MKLLKYLIKYSFCISGSILILACTKEKPNYHEYPITAIDIRNVVLTDSFWLPKIKIIQDTTIEYAFDKCDKEGRMENFLIAGGKMKEKTRGQMPFDDTDLYKIIEGASYSLISNPNPVLDVYLDSIISIIKTGQEPDGYITTWFTIDRKNPPAPWVKPSEKRWENEISSHELYNSGHLFEAAAAHYFATGKRNFLDIAVKNADLLVANFGPGKLQSPPGHQIVETGLIKLYQITKKKDYLELAKFYLDGRGDSTSHKLYGPYSQDHLSAVKQEEPVGHAVRAVYMYAGMTDIAALYDDRNYREAVMKLWENMVNKKLYITGGIGSRHEGEAFGDNYELPNLTAYNETCASIGSVHWNLRLFQLTGDSKYYDILERTLYNGLIAGISSEGEKFFYPNPLESDATYTFNKGSCTRQSWFDCSCCPTNLIRFLPSIPGLIYATANDSIYVNLFISNKANIKVKETDVELIQQSGFPWKGEVSLTLNPAGKSSFTLKIRVPGWARNNPVPGSLYTYIGEENAEIVLNINGKDEKFKTENGYINLTREWTKGDKVELRFPMTVRRVVTSDKVSENRGLVAFEFGPLVYCAEESDNNGHLSSLVIPDELDLKVEPGMIVSRKVNLITGTYEGNNRDKQKFVLVPYYLWSNRGIGKMKVWLPYLRSK